MNRNIRFKETHNIKVNNHEFEAVMYVFKPESMMALVGYINVVPLIQCCTGLIITLPNHIYVNKDRVEEFEAVCNHLGITITLEEMIDKLKQKE